MQRQFSVNLGNVILSLSNAMDLADPELAQHQLRTAFIVWEMGRTAGLASARMEIAFTAALLHDIGAASVEEKAALHSFQAEDVESHCIRGQILFESFPWLRDEAQLVRYHHRNWADWDLSIEDPVVFDSQMLNLADQVERRVDRKRYILHQHERIMREIKALGGGVIHPEVVELFMQTARREEFWLDLAAPRMYSLLLNRGPFKRVDTGLEDVLDIAQLFRNIIDFRSRFTATHSSGVAAAAKHIAGLYGFTNRETHLMEIAGNLHDIGKMAIPNRILDKPGKLDDQEMAVMRSHTYHTYEVINSIRGMQNIAEWASFHHERLDGSGYPFHCEAGGLDRGARILAVADVFTALAEDRPYREGLPQEKIMHIMAGMADDRHLDAHVVGALGDDYGRIRSDVVEKQGLARDYYEHQFASLEPN
ncbi:MAG: HD domain-containing protein [Desulfarculaceae bacterium]|nr:HD domain-containing protein [Desulfarculaceae bacterium]